MLENLCCSNVHGKGTQVEMAKRKLICKCDGLRILRRFWGYLSSSNNYSSSQNSSINIILWVQKKALNCFLSPAVVECHTYMDVINKPLIDH